MNKELIQQLELIDIVFLTIATLVVGMLMVILLSSFKKMKCDKCENPMKNWALQGLTNEGDVFYCKTCAEEYLSKCKTFEFAPMVRFKLSQFKR